MIKVNLSPRPGLAVRGRALRIVNLFLGLILLVQLVMAGSQIIRRVSADKGTAVLQAELKNLEAKREEVFARAADAVAVEGALRGRNAWLLGRAASPYLLLAKFEAAKPEGGFFVSFQGTRSSGAIRVLTPDLETAQVWLKTALGRLSGTLTVEGQDQEGVKVFYSWNE